MNQAVEEIYREMGEQCLPAPPIPPGLASEIRKVGEKQWGTEDFDPKLQYLHQPHIDKFVADQASEPTWLFGYWGHGTNSYAYSLTCRLGPLILVMQSHWVPWELYNDPISDAAELAELFQVARALLPIASERQGPSKVLVDASPFRAAYQVLQITPRMSLGPGASATARAPGNQMDSLAQARETATRLLTAGEDSPVPSTVIGDDE